MALQTKEQGSGPSEHQARSEPPPFGDSDDGYIDWFITLLMRATYALATYTISVGLAIGTALLYASMVVRFQAIANPSAFQSPELLPLTVFVCSIPCFFLWADAVRLGAPWYIWTTFVVMSAGFGLVFYGPIVDIMAYPPALRVAVDLGLDGQFGYWLATVGVLLLELIAARVALSVGRYARRAAQR